jgi:hypothetical protein
MKNQGGLVVLMSRLRVGQTGVLFPVDEIFVLKTSIPAVEHTGVPYSNK